MSNIFRRSVARRVLERTTPSAKIRAGFLLNRGSGGVSHLIANEFWEATGGTTYYGILKRWTGTAWSKALLKVYLASSWQAKSLKRWGGAEWKEVDTTGV